MSPSDKGFSQVKSILGKLDRSIDQLRQQRTTPIPAVVGPVGATQIPAPRPVIAPAPAALPAPSRSAFGRATPIRPV